MTKNGMEHGGGERHDTTGVANNGMEHHVVKDMTQLVLPTTGWSIMW